MLLSHKLSADCEILSVQGFGYEQDGSICRIFVTGVTVVGEQGTFYYLGFFHNGGITNCTSFIATGTTQSVFVPLENCSLLDTTCDPNEDFVFGLRRGSGAGFACFYVIDLTPMPVELMRFSGRAGQDAVQLQWETANESQNSYFEVEKSGDGNAFHSLGRVLGNGDSSTPSLYDFTDAYPLPGTNYYRLRQVDFDGQSANSHTIAVEYRPKNPMIRLYPTPAGDVLHLNWNSPALRTGQWHIYGLAGRLVKAAALPPERAEQEIDISGLAPGGYWLRVTIDSRTEVLRFVKS